MNPIVVKELRQGLQNWFIIIIVNLLLVALSLTCLLMVMLNPVITEEATGGRDIFVFLQVMLFIATVVGVPLYVLGRLRAERNGEQVDLFFTTTLKPQKIVRGKFVAGMSLVTLLYSVCLPFMLFTYFLRGYDVPTMLFTMAIGYFSAIPLVMLAIVIGTWTMPRIFSPFIMFAALGGLIVIVIGLSFLANELLEQGFQTVFRDKDVVWVMAIIFVVGFLVTKLLEAMAIGLLSPPSSNRTVRLRIWTTISIVTVAVGLAIWALTLISFGGVFRPWEASIVMTVYWFVICIPLLAVMMLIAMCEPDGFSNRVMIQRPRHFLTRLMAFPFTHGASGGFLWVFLHTIVVLAVFGTMVFLLQTVSGSAGGSARRMFNNAEDFLVILTLIFACFCAYALLSKIIMRIFGRSVPAKHTWMVFLFVAMVLMVASMLLCFAYDTKHWDKILFWKIFNPMATSDAAQTWHRVVIDSCWALAMVLLCVPQFVRDIKRYLFEKARTESE